MELYEWVCVKLVLRNAYSDKQLHRIENTFANNRKKSDWFSDCC